MPLENHCDQPHQLSSLEHNTTTTQHLDSRDSNPAFFHSSLQACANPNQLHNFALDFWSLVHAVDRHWFSEKSLSSHYPCKYLNTKQEFTQYYLPLHRKLSCSNPNCILNANKTKKKVLFKDSHDLHQHFSFVKKEASYK